MTANRLFTIAQTLDEWLQTENLSYSVAEDMERFAAELHQFATELGAAENERED